MKAAFHFVIPSGVACHAVAMAKAGGIFHFKMRVIAS
jgi:hypothetical protein